MADTTQPVANQQPTHVDEVNRAFKEKATAERAKMLKMDYVNIGIMPINPDYLSLVARDDAKQAFLLPFFRIGKKVRIAIAHPTNPKALEIIKKFKEDGFQININLATEEGVLEALKNYETAEYHEEVAPVENIVDESQIAAYEKEIEDLQGLKSKLSEVTAEEALNLITVGATKTGASDIHFQPEETHTAVRFRIDGVLQEIFKMDKKTYEYLANQLKYKCKMKLNISTEPQDGRFYFNFNKRKIDVRVSALPTEYGETFVLRLLDSGKKTFNFEKMGYTGRNLKIVKAATGIANGMILVTGPTGSGKTTMLYSMLKEFNHPENKIVTLEDPIEYHIENVAQSQINEKRGYTFGSGLRAILRQDPDVVMLGEIRDLETAETAAQAALTGHVLLSTLHTNSAVDTIPRLLNIGLKPYMIAPALHTIVAQRLVRVVCPYCSQDETVPDSEREEIEKILAGLRVVAPDLASVSVPATVKKAIGCPKCSHTGYSGRTAIAEIVIFDDKIRELVLAKKGEKEIFDAARAQGMLTLLEDGVLKVVAGVTTLEEVYRVAGVE